MQAYGITNYNQLDDSIMWMRCGNSKHGHTAHNGEHRAYLRNTATKNAYRQVIKGGARQKAKAALRRQELNYGAATFPTAFHAA